MNNNIEKILYSHNSSNEEKLRIIQELVPGRQITLAHIIANPDSELYKKLGLDPRIDYSHSAIGVLTVSPCETSIICADISMKASAIELGFVDRFSGTLVITGTISDVEAAFRAVAEYTQEKLGYNVCPITRT
ncbi:MAG: BMC domain-containing protein [Clostridia bacterium]|nr:BMC domain-containing protein [Clostridia bacterium]